MKRLTAMLLAVALVLGCMAGCSSDEENHKTTETTEGSAASGETVNGEETTETTEETVTVDTQFVLEYPADMQALGFTEPLVMDEAPQRVVCLSTSPVLALHELGANIIGVPISTVVVWPQELIDNSESVTFSVMGEDYDFESVLALEPDLILLASAARDTAGAALESLGMTVYYVYAGHTVSYESVKMQTQVLVDAFDMTEESVLAGQALMARFDALEAKLKQTRAKYGDTTVLVLQSGSASSHYAQTEKGTLGSMVDMIGMTNVYENSAASLAQVDLEQMLSYDPDYIICVGSGSAEYQRQLMQQAFDSNPDYWYAIDAVKNGNVICLDVSYISSAGINVIDQIEGLIDIIDAAVGE